MKYKGYLIAVGVLLITYLGVPIYKFCVGTWKTNDMGAYGSFFYTFVTLLTLVFVIYAASLAYDQLQLTGKQITKLTEQLAVTAAAQRLDTTVTFLERFNDRRYVAAIGNVYDEFCQKEFRIPMPPSVKLDANIRLVLRTFVSVGFLAERLKAERAVLVDARPDVCVRAWLMLESYIRWERDRNGTPVWQWHMQYLTILCLRSILSHRSQYPNITIYDRKDTNRQPRVFSLDNLEERLRHLETEFTNLGLPTT